MYNEFWNILNLNCGTAILVWLCIIRGCFIYSPNTIQRQYQYSHRFYKNRLLEAKNSQLFMQIFNWTAYHTSQDRPVKMQKATGYLSCRESYYPPLSNTLPPHNSCSWIYQLSCNRDEEQCRVEKKKSKHKSQTFC